MKKKLVIALCLAMSLCLLLCSCGDSGSSSGKSKDSKGVSIAGVGNGSFPDEKAAKACLKKVALADNGEDVADLLTKVSDDRAEQLANYYPDGDIQIELEYATTYNKKYDIFIHSIRYEDNDFAEEGALIFYRDGDDYLLCVETDIQEKIIEKYRCKPCNGNGSITTGNRVACAICGGTGVQTLQQMDPATGMMIPMTIGCGGCGGSGYTGSSTNSVCPTCDGRGVDF